MNDIRLCENGEARREVEELIAGAPSAPDLTDPLQARWVRQAADRLVALCRSEEEARRLEDALYARTEGRLPVLFLLALRNAISKLYVRRIDRPVKVSMVFAMYKEVERMQEKSPAHPHGENFLEAKARQMQWLFGDNPHMEWELIAVDDGCPMGSGREAEKIIRRKKLPHFRVLYLEEAIRAGLPVTAPMQSTADSQKGGAIAYGMWEAARQAFDGAHVVAYTDADLSTHLGQTGLLMEPLLEAGKKAAIGSRREPRSVSLKKGLRNDRGKFFIYLWKKMLPELDFITDTQCGFKAFTAPVVRQITEDLMEKKFAFDIELLLKTVLLDKNGIAIVPIVWIDSEAASTTTALSPYLNMLQQVARMQQKYVRPGEQAARWARFVLSLDQGDFEYLLQHIPAPIRRMNPKDFGSFDGVKPEDLEALLRGRRA